MRTLVSAAIAVLVLAPAGPRLRPDADANGIVARGVEAVGGEAALRGLQNVSIETMSINLNAGQEDLPFRPASPVVVSTRGIIDRVGRRYRIDGELRTSGGATPTILLAQRVTSDAAMANQGGRQQAAPRALQANVMRRMNTMMPIQLLALVDHPQAVTPVAPATIAGTMADGVRFAFGADSFTIYFERATGLPLQQVTRGDDPVRGDITTTTTWTRWSAGAVRFPGQINTEINDQTTNITSQRITAQNQQLEDSTFAIPDSIVEKFRNLPEQLNTGVNVNVSEVAPGLLRMTGQNYTSLIVEQGDRLVMVEAPVSAELTRAILDSAAGRFPAKRVAWMVNTHHHWDHASGVRTVLAAGIPVVTHGRNAEFVRHIGTARKTVTPDALSRGGRLPRIISVSDSLSLGTGVGQVQVFVTETTHGRSMVTAYVPAAGILFQSDMLTASTAGPIPKNQAREIMSLVQSRGLTVSQVVGGHGELTSMEAIEKAAQ